MDGPAEHPAIHDRLWGRRFAEQPTAATIDFMSGRDTRPSPPADAHLIADDLWATSAHVVMLGRQRIIPEADAQQLLDGLGELRLRHQSGELVLDPALEDVHGNIEAWLTELCGPETGGRVHTGRSRNDQVTTAMRIHLRDRALDSAGAAIDVARTLLEVAGQHRETVMPGFTHHQPATPTTLGHVLTAYSEALERDAARFTGWLDLHNHSPLGGAAGYGTTLPLDRELVANLLAFDDIHATSLDPITTRGEPESDLAMALAAMLKHLAALAQTLILLGSPGYGIIQLSPAYCSGSSLMPQKVNPCTLEAIKGKAAMAGGIVAGLLSVGSAAFMGYNRDSQWTKYLILELIDETRDVGVVMAGAITSMRVDVDRALELTRGNFLGSTALVEWLVSRHGLAVRQAKRAVETAVLIAEGTGDGEVTGPALRAGLHEQGWTGDVSDMEATSSQAPREIIGRALAAGGPAPSAVDAAIAALRRRLSRTERRLDAARDRIATARTQTYEACSSAAVVATG